MFMNYCASSFSKTSLRNDINNPFRENLFSKGPQWAQNEVFQIL